MENNELYHYGVKGMRWGHRKAQKYTKEANTYRRAAKEWDDEWKTDGKPKAEKLRAKGKHKKADKLEAEYKQYAKDARDYAKQYDTKAKQMDRYAKFNKKQADVGASRTKGAKLATNILAGPFANRTYNSVIAAGGSQNKARIITGVTAMVGGPIGHIVVGELYGHS